MSGFFWTAAERRRACDLRLGGLSLREIAAELGRSASQARAHLRRLGCPAPDPDALRERQGSAASSRNRALCAAAGWPEVVVPRQARVLAALARAGPLTHAGLARELGLPLHARSGGSGSFSPRLAATLAALCRPFRAEGGGPVKGWRYVERSRGRPPLYRVSAWLLERKGIS